MTHHSVAAHLCGTALLAQTGTTRAVLAGYDPLIVLALATAGALALGWLIEWSQRRWGWGTYSWADKAISMAGGPLGWALAMGAIHV